MRCSVILALLAICFVIWLPYLCLQFYWTDLQATVPGAATGEVSGPITYFLPRLFWLGVAGTVVVIVFGGTKTWLAYSHRKKLEAEQDADRKPDNVVS